ncbi:hypothetical protein PENFLA_c014G07140 [Penicillium flavigenum]|uniref:Gfo/Idh/MocA-like oxidoreductase N-terminal domain-containing protein n=1 Tax=Penicillium flavigenum TaxID=254877 RepID=A0A1V6T5F6_9EURO|nr:hypothetical protein PENFLA_c014G07140 [Penicillium flavigenum]
MGSIAAPKNVLIIGIGPHARKNHLPVLLEEQATGRIGSLVGVDTTQSSSEVDAFNAGLGEKALPIFFVPPVEDTETSLPTTTCDTLDSLAHRYKVNGVLVSTHPSVHRIFSEWAITRGLNVLLDKPLTVHRNCSTDTTEAARIHEDFLKIARLYDPKGRSENLLLSVHCQRRYHPAFLKMRDLIAEVTAKTNCPVTNIQSFHSDGQWRMPDELVDLSYHSYDCGYGKAAHSGYHFFDCVPWLLEAGESKGKEIDSATVHVHATRPNDFLGQLTPSDYDQIYPGSRASCVYEESELKSRMENFGEVDATVSVAFKSAGRTITLGNITLLHNGFSQRGSFKPHQTDLYKGNGRVRHETHIIHQGPFQAIYFSSLQTNDGSSTSGSMGSRDHIEINVFRNNVCYPIWEAHQHYDFSSLCLDGVKRESPTQAVARRRSIKEFIDFLHGDLDRTKAASDFMSHRRSSALMSAVYMSLAQQWNEDTSSVTVGFRRDEEGKP